MQKESLKNNENSQQTNVLLFYRFIFGSLGTLFVSISLVWFAIYSGIKFHHYKWIWSQNHVILAGQHLLNGLWCITLCISPLWWFWITLLTAKMLLPKYKKLTIIP